MSLEEYFEAWRLDIESVPFPVWNVETATEKCT